MYDDYDLDYTLGNDYSSSYDLDEMCENHVSCYMIQDSTSYNDEITSSYDDDEYLVSLDCKHFKPEELDVKVDGNTIVIVAKQEVKEAGGTRTRVFEQKFTLPNGVNAERVTSTINADGVLTINAPKGKPASTASVSQSIEQKMDKILSPSSWPDHSLGSVTMDDFNDNSNSRV